MKAFGHYVFLHNTIQETVGGLILEGHLQVLSVGGLVPLHIEEGYSVMVDEEKLIPINSNNTGKETFAIHWENILGHYDGEVWL